MGGLGRDLNAHKSYTPSMREVVNEAAEVNFGCSENCLGNGYQMARDIDAYVFNSPPTQGSNTRINNHGEVYGAGWLEYIWGHDAGIIEVNLNGERFNDECSFEDYYNKKMWSKQPRMESVIIFDSETLATPDGQTYAQPLIDTVQAGGADTVKSADTIEELAEAFGIPAETLVKTVEEFNAHVDPQEPDEFGRTSFAMKVATPPFWGGRTDVVVGISKGGCKIDPQARVIDTKDRVIPVCTPPARSRLPRPTATPAPTSWAAPTARPPASAALRPAAPWPTGSNSTYKSGLKSNWFGARRLYKARTMTGQHVQSEAGILEGKPASPALLTAGDAGFWLRPP